ncbi:MAG TPA: hypothetical protein VNW15_02110 [Rhizomicrobium sp.]|jgi:hypothetical protein|nr:hypothetical protein [Rhizomicrobium sp.]
MSVEAEAFVRFSGAAGKTALEAARGAAGGPVSFEPLPGGLRIAARADNRMDALTAAAMAALALIAALKDESASIEGVRAIAPARPPRQKFQSRGSLSKENNGRIRPEVLMGEVTGPKPSPDQSREAFRNFMTSHRLRPTVWAKDAGVSSGEILGFLTGRSRGFSDGVAEKLAKAARVRVEDMFQ